MTLVPTTDNRISLEDGTWEKAQALQGQLPEGRPVGALGDHGCIPRCKGIRSVSGVTVCVKSSSSL